MCTCGIDIATQQADAGAEQQNQQRVGRQRQRRLALGRFGGGGGCMVRVDLPRSSSDNGSMVTRQNTPMPIYVKRQPSEPMKCCTTGGQIVPAR